ncbi:MAG: MBL fold metallo-hydrolase [Sulfurimonas sp.]|uniref:MBL fold metallo-hydrolase n=1 Tax=Sulfurimonas sp. TaxID=2022749 RepID=UPI003D0D08F3
MLKKMINPFVVSAIALLPIMTACSSDNSSKSEAPVETKVEKPAPVVAAQTPDFDYKLEPKQVSENVWCFFGALEMPTKENAGYMSNSCYIKTNDSYVLWDTGASYIFAKQAYEAMTKVAGKLPVKTIMLSHEHDDHWLGNNYYKEVHGAEIVGPESINKNYHAGDITRMFKILPENAIRGTKIIPVDKWHKETIKFAISGVNFEYVPVGNGHSVEDYFLYMPDNKLILAGDLVMNGRVTSNRDGSVEGQIAALEVINSKDWTVLIPGHGFIIDKTATDESVQYFTLTRDRVQEAMDNGVDSVGIVEAVPLEEFKDKNMYDILNSLNVSRAYLEYDMGLPEHKVEH